MVDSLRHQGKLVNPERCPGEAGVVLECRVAEDRFQQRHVAGGRDPRHASPERGGAPSIS
eukprot:2545604-Lingulodinium_polyedra.AAC.1